MEVKLNPYLTIEQCREKMKWSIDNNRPDNYEKWRDILRRIRIKKIRNIFKIEELGNIPRESAT